MHKIVGLCLMAGVAVVALGSSHRASAAPMAPSLQESQTSLGVVQDIGYRRWYRRHAYGYPYYRPYYRPYAYYQPYPYYRPYPYYYRPGVNFWFGF
jgi:hypothetical protein